MNYDRWIIIRFHSGLDRYFGVSEPAMRVELIDYLRVFGLTRNTKLLVHWGKATVPKIKQLDSFVNDYVSIHRERWNLAQTYWVKCHTGEPREAEVRCRSGQEEGTAPCTPVSSHL